MPLAPSLAVSLPLKLRQDYPPRSWLVIVLEPSGGRLVHMNGMIHSLARGKVVLPIFLSALLVLVLTGLVMFYIKGENV